MQRLLLTLRYDGTAYHGWQVQPNARTVQQTLQDAVEALTGVRSGVIGCSRTDAGVHAKMFCCTFDTESKIPPERMPAALNSFLPEDIAVYACSPAAADFHPRYAARGKRYTYYIWNSAYRNPFFERFSLRRVGRLDAELLHAAAQQFVGKHDFSAFCSADADTTDAVRTVFSAAVRREGDMVCFTVEADGFLYNMVRIMVGTLLDIAGGKLTADTIPAALASGDRTKAGATAPAKGLFLEKVFYGEETADGKT